MVRNLTRHGTADMVAMNPAHREIHWHLILFFDQLHHQKPIKLAAHFKPRRVLRLESENPAPRNGTKLNFGLQLGRSAILRQLEKVRGSSVTLV